MDGRKMIHGFRLDHIELLPDTENAPQDTVRSCNTTSEPSNYI